MTKERLDIPEVEGDEPIISYRDFRVIDGVGGPRLAGLRDVVGGGRRRWHTRTRTAVCDQSMLTMVECRESGFEHDTHLCGIYSRKLPSIEIGPSGAIAEVENRGLVIEHQRGYRAEEVTIRRLWLIAGALSPERALGLSRKLARHYDVPCVPVGSIWDVHREAGTYEQAVGLAQAETTREMFRRWEEKDLWQTLVNRYGSPASLSGSVSWTLSGFPPAPSLSQNQSQLDALMSQLAADQMRLQLARANNAVMRAYAFPAPEQQPKPSRWDRLMDWWVSLPEPVAVFGAAGVIVSAVFACLLAIGWLINLLERV